MGVYGLIGSADLKTTIKKMTKFQCTDYLIVTRGMSVKEILAESLASRKVTVIELLDLVDIELSNAQLFELFTELIQHGIEINIIKKEVELSNVDYFKLVYHVLQRDYQYRSSLQKEKLRDARNKGVILGRPSLLKDEITEIIELREKYGLTYREIAVKTGVSLGTVSKYCKEVKKQSK